MNPSAIPSRAGPPPLIRRRRSPSIWLGGLLLGLAALGGVTLVFFFDPAVTPFYPGFTG